MLQPQVQGFFYKLLDTAKILLCTAITTSISCVYMLAKKHKEFFQAQIEKFDWEYSQTPDLPPATTLAPSTGAIISTPKSNNAIKDFLTGM